MYNQTYNRVKMSNFVHLAIQSTLAFLSVKYLTSILHELGHCLGAWLAGLRPVGMYVTVFGGSMSFNFGTRNFWQHVTTSSLGPAVDLFLGLIILFLILPRAKKWGAKLFWLYSASVTLIAFWGYMIIGGFMGGGDFGSIARAIGVTRYLAGVFGLAGVVGFAFLISRHILKAFSPYFKLDSYRRRFPIMLLFIGVPGMVFSVGGYFVSANWSMKRLLIMILLAAVISGLLSLFRSETKLSFQRLPKWPSLAGFLISVLVVVSWLGLFGSTPSRAKGILWSYPGEYGVQVCNIIILIKKDFTSDIDFLMRPYANQMFWRKTASQPPNWPVYEKFIGKAFPILLGDQKYEIVKKVHDVSSPFFYGGSNMYGTRRISLRTNLKGSIKLAEENTCSLEISDYYRAKGTGFLDKLQVVLEEGMSFSGYELIPTDAREPDIFSEEKIVWENPDIRAPKKVRLNFSCPSKNLP